MYSTESDLIRLVEDRGIGIHPFKEVIDEISNYVQQCLDNNKYNGVKQININLKNGENVICNEYKIIIPKKLTQKFDWIDNFYIMIHVDDLKNNNIISFVSGTGSTSIIQQQKIINVNGKDKLNMGMINIWCYSINKQLVPRLLYLNLYHEFNHNWENFQRLLKNYNKQDGYNNEIINNGLYFLHNKQQYNNIINNIGNHSNENVRNFCYILYRLFISDEFNAMVSSVYGDLKGMNSNSYKGDYKNTEAYKIYYNIKNKILPKLNKLPNEEWKILLNYYSLKYINNIESFKEKFNNECEYKLTDLFHNITKTASLYYEDKFGNKTIDEERGIDFNIESCYIIDSIKEHFDKDMKSKQFLYNVGFDFQRFI